MVFKYSLSKAIFLLIIINLVFSVEPDSEINYNFELIVNSEKQVIYNKSLHWIKKTNQQKSIKINARTMSEWVITGSGKVFINRLGTNLRVPADYSYKIKCMDQKVLITYSNIKIYQHGMIFSEFQKNSEMKELKKIFTAMNQDLVEFIKKEERGFLEWFNWWGKDYFIAD